MTIRDFIVGLIIACILVEYRLDGIFNVDL